MKTILLHLLLLPALCTWAYSPKADKFYAQAENYYREKNTEKALSLLTEILSFESGHIPTLGFLGKYYLATGNFSKSAEFLSRLFEAEPTYYNAFSLANALSSAQDFDKAIPMYEYYLDQSPDKNSKSYRLSEKYLRNCRFAATAIKNPLEVTFENLGPDINSRKFQYDPAISADSHTMIFTALDTINGNITENLYQSTYNGKKWTKGHLLTGKINSEQNEGSPFLSADGQILLFTGCNRMDGQGSCDIYFCVRTPAGWSAPGNMGSYINSSSWDAHASLSSDGRTLYFSSNRRGGKGGKDIWTVSLNNKDVWGPVKPVWDINTEGDEVTPYIHFDGRTLYFSSDGQTGMGNLDFFVTRKGSDSTFSHVQNLGYPINTPQEEYSLKVDRNGHTAYFASTRTKDTSMELFRFELPESFRAQRMVYLAGKILDEDGLQLKTADFTIFAVDDHGENISYFYRNGEYTSLLGSGRKYGIWSVCEGYLPYSETFLFSPLDSEEVIHRNISLSGISKGKTITLSNVYFERDSSVLSLSSYRELDLLCTFLEKNPDLEIEIGGHTDNTGSREYNMKLSLDRAESVRKYICGKNIDKSRAQVKAYGDTMPRKDNTSEQGRAANRRTEMKIL